MPRRLRKCSLNFRTTLLSPLALAQPVQKLRASLLGNGTPKICAEYLRRSWRATSPIPRGRLPLTPTLTVALPRNNHLAMQINSRIVGLFPAFMSHGGVQEAGRQTAAAFNAIARGRGWRTEYL